jgi:hypothetical protein
VARDFNVLQPVFVGLDDNVGGDGVARLQLIDVRWRFEGVGHEHLVHESGDGFVVDVHRPGVLVYGDDFSFEGIAPGSRGRV